MKSARTKFIRPRAIYVKPTITNQNIIAGEFAYIIGDGVIIGANSAAGSDLERVKQELKARLELEV